MDRRGLAGARPAGFGVGKWRVGLLCALLAGCGPIIPPHNLAPPAPPPPQTALTAGVTPGPAVASLGLGAAGPALAAFREACPRLVRRNDTSGLTRPGDWQAACAAAANWPAEQAAQFFATYFETAIVGSGAATLTGYFEPEIAGSRTHLPGYDTPVYAVPPDLVHARPGDAPVRPNGQTPFGMYDAQGHFGPYLDRSQIEAGALAGRGLEIAWAQDPVALFFLQIQGSGRLRAPDGSVVRIGYAADNGHDYTAIGAVMRQQGLIGTGPGQYPGSMQGIVQYLHDQPVAGQALMDQNKSWVFFREITGDGPIGALGVPVRAHVSLAADPLFVPLGAPVFLAMDPAIAGATQANGLWVAEDTGGAIKGANRFDSFWGAGADAQRIAGGLFGHGQTLIFVPRGTLARLTGAPAAPPPYQPQPSYQPQSPRPQTYAAPAGEPAIAAPPLDAGELPPVAPGPTGPGQR